MSPTPAASQNALEEWQGRDRHPLEVFFQPRSVAVIGATETEGSVGRAAMWNLISSPFGGTVYPVNPKRKSVLGLRTYPNVGALPEVPELALVATPAATVPEIIRDCVSCGVRGAVILSAGFREIGPSGEQLERSLLEEARKGALRVLGPNCLGVMRPSTGLNATFANRMARPGNVAFLSQSGALCSAVLDWSHRELVGFSAFVSVGSMADLGWGDFIDYLANDPRTRSILLYMESVGDARSFLSAAREAALSKPVIVIRAGRTREGTRAAAAHTGAVCEDDEVFDAALRRCGVLRVHHIADLFYMAEVLGKQPRPQGNRLAIVTNAGGPGVLAADALIVGGGALAQLTAETMESLNRILPQEWSRNNPVDILGDAAPERFAQAVEVVSRDPNADGLLAVLAPQAPTDPSRTAEALKPFAQMRNKPLLASWMGGVDVAAGTEILQAAGIPTFPYPDTAARMFLYMWAYHENLRSIYETPLLEAPVAQPGEAPVIAKLRDASELTPDETRQLLRLYEIELPENSCLSAGCFIDPQFGPVLYAQCPHEGRSLGLPPLTTTLARRMLERLRAYRSNPDQQMQLERVLVRLGRLVVEQPRIRELKLGPGGVHIALYPLCTPPEKLPQPAIRPYPSEYAGRWRMKNGEEILIRPIRPEDEPLMVAFHKTLSDRTVYFRYLSALKLSSRIAHERLVRNCFIDYSRQMALVAERRDPQTGEPQIIAVGRLTKDSHAYARGRREAEFALLVGDQFQGLGLGSELLRRLLDIGKREGIAVVYGEIAAENERMQAVCRHMGFVIRRSWEDATVTARIALEPDQAVRL